MSEGFQKWDEIKLSADNYTKIWSIYLTWFNWFFGINVGAMAYIAATKDNVKNTLVYPLCGFMLGCVIIGIITACLMVIYSNSVTRHAVFIAEKIFQDTNHRADAKVVTASPMTNIVSWLILITLVWTFVAWGFIALWASGHFPLPLPTPQIAA